MRKVMILILSITILNYNINVFADTSVQHEYSGIENTESVGDIEEKAYYHQRDRLKKISQKYKR